jgi:signal transduction histidine kinase
MFPLNLKTNIAIHLAVLLVLAMVLIDFVMVITAQKILIGSEISKADVFVSGVEAIASKFAGMENSFKYSDFQNDFSRMINEAGISCALLMGVKQTKTYSEGKSCVLKDELETLVRQAIRSGKKSTTYFGTTWGVLWKQKRNMVVSVPLFREGHTVAGLGIVLSFEGVYETLRQTQYILLAYIFINAVVFTLAGLHRLSRVTVKPLQRLAKRAGEYRDDDEMFFLFEKENNEFNTLSKALNSMLRHISADKKQLQATVVALEKANVELKQAQQDIMRAEKLTSIGRLSSGIAHEIGNPIGIVVGYLELLKQNGISDDDKKEFIFRTESEINRINTIIQQLLDLSKPSGQGLTAVSVHAIIEETIDAFKFHPSMSDIKLELDLSAKKDIVMADSNQLRQVFLNLVLNAADAISADEDPLGGKIKVTSEVVPQVSAVAVDHSEMLMIKYIDNGPGIEENHIGNIFDPFYTTKEPGKGTGLGLSVSFMIVEGIGGKIEASSEKGKGTTIAIYLPICND